jgi:hypothetical protein
MRNSWDHIRSAKKPLDKRQAILAGLANQAQLFRRLGWEIGSPWPVYTGIVIANRVFHGTSLNGQPFQYICFCRHSLKGALSPCEFERDGDTRDPSVDLIERRSSTRMAKRQSTAPGAVQPPTRPLVLPAPTSSATLGGTFMRRCSQNI